MRALVDETGKRFGRLDIAVYHTGTEDKLRLAVDQAGKSYARTVETRPSPGTRH
jgi:hypothetical protein